MLSDRVVAEVTLKAGYIQCARPVGGSYDPICFDAIRASNNGEFPIVRLDHEEILRHGKILAAERLPKSFIKYAAAIAGRA